MTPKIFHETASEVPKYEASVDNHGSCAVFREFLISSKDLSLPIGLHY